MANLAQQSFIVTIINDSLSHGNTKESTLQRVIELNSTLYHWDTDANIEQFARSILGL